VRKVVFELHILFEWKTIYLRQTLSVTLRANTWLYGHHIISCLLRPWQTRTHCGGHIVADTNVSPFARAGNICCGHKCCVWDTKNVSDFVRKHFVSAANVSQFAQPKKHHEQQCVRNNVFSFARAFKNYFAFIFSPKFINLWLNNDAKQMSKRRHTVFNFIKLLNGWFQNSQYFCNIL